MFEVPSAAELREFLKKNGLTGAAVAALCGVDPRTVRKWTADEEASNSSKIPHSAWKVLQDSILGMKENPFLPYHTQQVLEAEKRALADRIAFINNMRIIRQEFAWLNLPQNLAEKYDTKQFPFFSWMLNQTDGRAAFLAFLPQDIIDGLNLGDRFQIEYPDNLDFEDEIENTVPAIFRLWSDWPDLRK